MKVVAGINCYELKEASKLYGEKNAKNFWRILNKLKCPMLQPTGTGGKIYFPCIPFDQWITKIRNAKSDLTMR